MLIYFMILYYTRYCVISVNAMTIALGLPLTNHCLLLEFGTYRHTMYILYLILLICLTQLIPLRSIFTNY